MKSLSCAFCANMQPQTRSTDRDHDYDDDVDVISPRANLDILKSFAYMPKGQVNVKVK